MNNVFLIGNLAKDPELTETASGAKICRFTIAVNRPYPNGDGEKKADFFDCTAWRGLAESVAQYCKKGGKVAVSGSIQMRTYEKNNGEKCTVADIIARDVEFLNANTRNDEDKEYSAEQRKRIGNAIESYENGKSGAKKPVQQRMKTFDDDGDIPF